MSFESKFEKYAEIAVKVGANVQPGQLLLINGEVQHAEYIRKIVAAAYKAGAGEVIVNWSDPLTEKMTLVNASDEVLSYFPQWQIDKGKDYQKRGCATINILSSDPYLLDDVNPEKMKIVQLASHKATQELKDYTIKNIGQWSVICLPNPTWAKLVFPDCSEEDAMKKMWDDIFAMNHITDDNDPVAAWQEHTDRIIEHGRKLTAYQFKELRFKNKLGTDITLGLVNDHIWCGGVEHTPKGVGFNPNMPTEEIFSMPHRLKTNGRVYASRPLSIQGKLVKDFWFEFKDGVVVDFGASENYESLKNLLETDEGAKHLGEIALISADSPISNTGRLYYNGLIDENASCHMAVGTCYPANMKGGNDLSEEELMKRGGNVSMIHIDFMFGTEDMSVIGIDQNDNEVVVFKDGNFVF